jgi:uncharacterized protein with von Willebrand factor type A (vWA) domain
VAERFPRRPGSGRAADAGAGYAVPDVLVGLARTLRAAGVDASPDRVHVMAAALARLDAGRRRDVYWSGRLTLCRDQEDLARYDRVFAAYFGDRPNSLVRRPVVPKLQPQRMALPSTDDPDSGDEPPGKDDEREAVSAAASRTEQLRSRDVAELDAAERHDLYSLLAAFRLPGEVRRSRRRTPATRGSVDRARTARLMLRHGGELDELRRHRRSERPRRVVLLVDISGSMAPYSDALLRFAHAAGSSGSGVGGGGSGRPVEVFTVGTRLTRVTKELTHRDPDEAMRATSAAIPDWSGGTRLGDLLAEFLDRWGQRGMARGAVVVILSDGWERGDETHLGAQMARLHRLAHRVVWANPLKARPGYAPLAAGMAAALPHVDDFVEGHSLAALERLAAVVAGARRAREGARAHA